MEKLTNETSSQIIDGVWLVAEEDGLAVVAAFAGVVVFVGVVVAELADTMA